jgi:glutamate formiminotransferase
MILAVPNWSFGRSKELLRKGQEVLDSRPVQVHFCSSDVDHNRTVTAFSADTMDVVAGALFDLCEVFMEGIDLTRHSGVHPRIGALDVCPFIPHEIANMQGLIDEVDGIAEKFATAYGVPTFLYEKSEKGRHEADLPALRKGGFGGLLGKDLKPDFGPCQAHSRWGATVMGVRGFLVALNVNFPSTALANANSIASEIRRLRTDGDPRFLGVRALGLPLASQESVQVSMNITLPDVTPLDPIVEYVQDRGLDLGLGRGVTELIGVIREKDLEHASRILYRPEQVVEGAYAI